MKLFSILLLLVTVGAWADSDSDFFGSDAPTVTTPPPSNENPTAAFEDQAPPISWGGTLKADATWNGAWLRWPDVSRPQDGWHETLTYDLTSVLFVDARPDKSFRFHLGLQAGAPFTTNTTVSTGQTVPATTTVSVPTLKVWEMFADTSINDTVFLRFGKQSASWGVSYFYSPADVISLTAKDVTDPTAQLEGPVAFKAMVPFPQWKANVTAFLLARDSYFDGATPSVEHLGYALQGDLLVGDAQLSLGGFYQKDNAPKLVASVNTGLAALNLPVQGDLNVFTEAVISRGSDVLDASGSSGGTAPSYTQIRDWPAAAYYTATAGGSYTSSDGNVSVRVEYLFNPFGSNDPDAAWLGYNTYYRFLAENTTGIVQDHPGHTFGYGDVAMPGMHNLTALLTLSDLAGTDKLTSTTLWQQNLSDHSGWVYPLLKLQAWKELAFTWGLKTVYGADHTQFPLQFQARDAAGNALGTQRVILCLGVIFGTGRY